MSAKSSDLARIREAYCLCQQVISDVNELDFTAERFCEPESTSDALIAEGFTNRIFRIVEEAGRFPDDFETYGVPIHEMRGLRNILAHAYGDIDTAALWNVITKDIPALMNACVAYCEDRGISLE